MDSIKYVPLKCCVVMNGVASKTKVPFTQLTSVSQPFSTQWADTLWSYFWLIVIWGHCANAPVAAMHIHNAVSFFLIFCNRVAIEAFLEVFVLVFPFSSSRLGFFVGYFLARFGVWVGSEATAKVERR